MKTLYWLSFVLAVVGALNWGLVGFFGFDLVAYVFSGVMALARLVYILVGLAGAYLLIASFGGHCAYQD